MPRIEPLTDDAGAPLDTRELIYFADEEGAPDPRVVRIWGRTAAGAAYLRAWRTVFHTGLVEHRLKELMRLNMSFVEQCGYCSSVRSVRARREGVTPELVMELADYESSDSFTPREKAALRFGDRWKADAVDDDEAYADLREHFSDEEIIELGIVCCFMESGRFVRSLQIVTWDEACEIDPAVRLRAGETVS
jgi:AhpD family alkylhydroperoxidase